VVLFRGLNDNSTLKVQHLDEGQRPHFFYEGNLAIDRVLDDPHLKKTQLTLDTNPRQAIKINSDVDLFFNTVANPDRNSIALEKVRALAGQLPSRRCLNRPEAVATTTRDGVYRQLKHIPNLRVPETISVKPTHPADVFDAIANSQLKLPVIFREAGAHGGRTTHLIRDENEQFHPFALDGRSYYLTQFLDVKRKGAWTKYRLVVIDGAVFMRHAMQSTSWMVHASSHRNDPAFKAAALKRFREEQRREIAPTIAEIHRVLGLDYFGIDCDIDRGVLTVFEANASMNIFANMHGSIFTSEIEAAKRCLNEMTLRAADE
jgi:glutathione synthase/RimK-type ligase-like ATP-grasp enzyme